MNLARPILLAALAVALVTYAVDCDAAMSPEDAAHCCDSMPCAPHGHDGQNCCKAMSPVHAPFVQPPAAHGISHATFVVAVLPRAGEPQARDFSFSLIAAAHCHAPPVASLSAPLPLRI